MMRVAKIYKSGLARCADHQDAEGTALEVQREAKNWARSEEG